jgi:outer membrane lipoprotein-sorting protein
MFYFLIILFTAFTLQAQQQNPDEILNNLKQRLDSFQDYEVDLSIKVDMEFLRIPNVVAKVYFKQPDKMKMESDDFAVLPKEGINFSPAQILKNKYSAIYIKSDTLNKSNVDVVKLIPLEDSVGIVLTTLWIDSQKKIIRKIETTTKNRGTFQIKLFYDLMEEYGLPAKMQFSFSTDNVEIPETLTMDAGVVKKPLGKISKNLTGNIEVTYTNYKINQGLEDNFFEKKE